MGEEMRGRTVGVELPHGVGGGRKGPRWPWSGGGDTFGLRGGGIRRGPRAIRKKGVGKGLQCAARRTSTTRGKRGAISFTTAITTMASLSPTTTTLCTAAGTPTPPTTTTTAAAVGGGRVLPSLIRGGIVLFFHLLSSSGRVSSSSTSPFGGGRGRGERDGGGILHWYRRRRPRREGRGKGGWRRPTAGVPPTPPKTPTKGRKARHGTLAVHTTTTTTPIPTISTIRRAMGCVGPVGSVRLLSPIAWNRKRLPLMEWQLPCGGGGGLGVWDTGWISGRKGGLEGGRHRP